MKARDKPFHLSARVDSVEVSPTVATAARASLLRAMGRDILDFSVGEPDQGTPNRIKQAATEAMTRGETRYVPSLGIPALRKAVAERYLIDDGLTFDPNEVAITLGGKQAYALACETVLDPGDPVVIPTPYWPTFSEAVRLAGGVPVFAPLDGAKGFAFDPELIMRKVRKGTRLLVINSPSNPTGAVVSERALLHVARSLKSLAPDAFLLYDDTYARMRYIDPQPRMLPRTKEILGDRFMIAGTASKTYCMTGWRIGWLLAPKEVIQGVSAFISHQTQCAASFAQFGAVEALNGPQDFVGEQLTEYRARRDLMVAGLNAIPGISCRVPQGAFYAFPSIQKLLTKAVPDALTFSSRLLDDQGVAVVAGEGFGCPGYVRISFARSQKELRRGLEAIRRFVASLPAEPKTAPAGVPKRGRAARA